MSENRKKRKSIWLKRPLALLLALVMMITSVDMSVFATEATEITQAETSTEQEIETQVEESEEETAEVSTEEESEEEAAEVSTEEESEEEAAEVPTEEESEEEAAKVSTEEESEEETNEALAEEETAPTEEGEEETLTENEETLVEVPAQSSTSKTAKTMLASSDASTPDTVAEDSPTEIDVSSYGDSTVYIYSSLYFSDAATGSKQTASGQGYVLKGTAKKSIEIGNQDDVTGGGKIEVSFNGLSTPELVITSITGDSGDKYAVEATIDAASTITALELEENAILNLTLNADLTIDSITLDEGSKLNIDTNGHTLTVKTLSAVSDADVSIKGTGTVNAEEISADTLDVTNTTLNVSENITAATRLTFDSANVTLSGGKITSEGEINVAGSTIENAALLGFTATTIENKTTKTINVDSAVLENVTVVGAEDGSNDFVTIEGTASTSGTTSLVQDHKISYEAAGVDLTVGEDWPIAYRVSNDTMIGYHTKNGYVTAAEVTLPTVTQDGYKYIGWTLEDADVTKLTGALSGAITLVAKLEPGTVIITRDLGYEPSEYTNDKPLPVKVTTLKSVVAGEVELTNLRPVRFGYEFNGWLSDKGSIIDKDAESYTVQLNDLTKVEGEDYTYTMTLTAQWAEDTFPLVLLMGNVVASDNIEISLDGGITWAKVADVTNTWSFASFDTDGNAISFAVDKWITYNHNLGEHFTENGMSYPMLRDAGLTKKFESWKLNGADYAVTEETVYNLENGLLKNSNNQNLVDYQAELKNKPVTLEPVWGAMDYTLTTSTADGWKILVDGIEVTPVDGKITVTTGKTVTYQCSKDSKAGISLWSFKQIIGENNTLKFVPAEREYKSGETVLSYDFRMPACDVTATYGKVNDLWLNIFTSPITFENSFIHNKIGRDGFWYEQLLDEMTPLTEDPVKGYFYTWDMNTTVQVTSGNEPTTNQLTLAEGSKVKFKNCVMVARQEYSADFVDRNYKGTVLEGATLSTVFQDVNLAQYGNIVLNNNAAGAYTVTFTFEGENTIATIFHNEYRGDTYGAAAVKLQGADASSKLNLACSFGNTSLHGSKNLIINQYVDTTYQSTNPDNFETLFHITINGIGMEVWFEGCTIAADKKRIYMANGKFGLKSYGQRQSLMEIDSASINWWVAEDSTQLKVDNSLSASLELKEQSCAVVGGNFYGTSSLNTEGYLVVKGNTARMYELTVVKGTLIANAIEIGRRIAIKGGTVITNLILSQLSGAGGLYAGSNHDNIFFVTYPDRPGQTGVDVLEYEFLAGEVYLLGHYGITDTGEFDKTITSETEGNLIKNAVDAVINGTELNKVELVNQAREGAKECLILGNSTFTTGSLWGKALFEFSGANVYAAGNMLLNNETTISAGIIDCAGILSCKHDLYIEGGTVTAKEIGNAYNLKEKLSDGSYRWSETVISGGTVKTDRLGASSRKLGTVEPRSTVVLSVPVQPLTTNGTVKIVQDIYANYIVDSNIYSDAGGNPETFRFTTDLSGEVDSLTEVEEMNFCADDLTAAEAYTFTPPVAVDGEEAGWRLDSLQGSKISTVAENGSLLYETTAITGTSGYAREVMRLYASKENYSLIVKAGLDKLSTEFIYIEDNHTNTETFVDSTAKVPMNAQVQLTLTDPAMADKVVVWYYDGNRVLHNAMPVVENDKIIFTMPATNAEVFVTNDLSLYLNEYDILFTPYGFALDLDADPNKLNVASDRVYLYRGNLTVTQSNIAEMTRTYDATNGFPTTKFLNKSTGNIVYSNDAASLYAKYEMVFAANGGNANTTANALVRDITLTTLYQYNNTKSRGILIPENEQVVFKVNGPITTMNMTARAGSSLKIEGISERTELSKGVYPQDSLAIQKTTYETSAMISAAGNMTYENLNLVPMQNVSYFVSGSSTNTTITYDHCYIHRTYNTGQFVDLGYAKEINVLDCYMEIGCPATNNYKGTLYIKDSEIISKAERINWFLTNVGKLVLDNSNLTLNCTRKQTLSTVNSASPKDIQLINGSNLKTMGRLDVNALELHDTSSVQVEGEPDSYLLCPNLVVNDNASVSADYILVSGYRESRHELSNSTDLQNALNRGDGLLDGNAVLSRTGTVPVGLVMNGGTVTAAEFIGGDVNGKLTVNSGTLTSNKIGTYGANFAYMTYIEEAGKDWVYSHPRIPVAATVTVNGGTVNVTEDGYLGGMNAAVNINGGTVNMADNTLLGLSDEDYQKLVDDAAANHKTLVPHTITIGDDSDATTAKITGTASINVPKGSVTIKGSDTEVNVKDILASGGTITIEEANGLGGKLDNPYTGTDGVHNQVGVAVDGTLKAQNVTIQNGAIVYAKEAYAEAELGETGALNVTAGDDGNAPAYLYIGTGYGTLGSGDVAINIDNDNQEPETYSHVYGATYRKITYHLMDDEIDAATNPAENKKMFEFGSGEEIVLSDPLRHGYIFKGWYDNEEFTGDIITRIFTNANRDYDLYAKWEPKTVEFTIVVDGQSLGLTSLEELKGEVAGLEGTLDEANMTFTFKATSTVAYLDTLLDAGKGHIDVNAYSLKTYSVKAMAIDDDSYKGGESETIAASAVVTRELLAAYEAKKVSDKNATIRVVITGKLKDNVLLTLDLNLDPDTDRPVGSKFNNTTAPDNHTATTISSYVAYGNTIAAANGFVDATGKMITASAPGYTFKGWYYKDASDNKVFINETFQITRDSAKTFYAEMIPNEYLVEFDATEGAVVTVDDEVPDNTDGQKISGLVTYDTYINEGIDYASGEINQPLPSAWKEGYVFVGWSYGNSGEMINDFTELNLTTIPGDYLNVNAESNETALTLKAVYRPVNVTYNLNGGKWNGTAATANPAYADALAGYTKTGDGIYEIISTSKDDFKVEDGQPVYVENDYRHVLGRKGYTFKGWIDKDGNEVKTTPKYEDIELTAQWDANTYTLQLNATDDELRGKRAFGHEDTPANPKVTVTVDERIAGADVTAWPSRDKDGSDWYVQNLNDTSAAERYLLGFTFDALDPGDTRDDNPAYGIYQKYGANVNILTNNKTLFVKAEGEQTGSTFFLPESGQYNDLIDKALATNVTEVPDYPDGSTIQMYAIYREISLVFIHYVQQDDGTIVEKVMHTATWDEYSDYPDTTYRGTQEYRDTVENDYALIGWYLHGPSVTAQEYTEAYYDKQDNQDKEKGKAKDSGAYDIKVYTVYAKRVTEEDVVLAAGSDPKVNKSTAETVYEYTIPGSMQSGYLRYTLSELPTGLNLVDKDTMMNDRFSNTKANNTVAIKVELIKPDGTVDDAQTTYLTNDNLSGTFANQVGKGWKIRLTLYYSSVMSDDDADYVFDLKFTFDNDTDPTNDTDPETVNTLINQWLLLHEMMVDLTPSIWEVTYEAILDPEDVIVEDWKEFNGTSLSFTDDVAYGSAVLGKDALPEVEGYAPVGTWTVKNGTDTVDYGGDLDIPVSEVNAGKITLTTEWEIQSYRLTATKEVLGKWTIKDAMNGELTADGASVPYRTAITFTPNGNQEPAYIFINGTRLDKYEGAIKDANGVYTILMPAEDVEVTYSRVMTLYLRYGDIDITPDGYTHRGETVDWPGDYAILMDENRNAATPTDNRLSISGDMSGRMIALDNLNIADGEESANDSIKLATGTIATLTTSYNNAESTIKAKNILVPADSNLTMNGEGTLVLTPDKNYAAIGGNNDACGTITLNSLSIDMTLPAGSVASGIGSGNQVNGGASVTISDCNITVTETSNTAFGPYNGAWFGGADVISVTLQNTTVTRGAASEEIAGTEVTNGKTVILSGTTIGTAENPVTTPVKAQDALTLQAYDEIPTHIYLKLSNPNAVAIETDPTGVITVANGSSIDATVAQPKVSDAGHKVLYTGAMHIMDAKSDVVIANTQVVETKHGKITIATDGVKQDSATHEHDGNYRLIAELDTLNPNNTSLTVNGLNGNSVIETTRLKLNTVKINADATIELLADLEFVATGSLNIAEGKTLTVEENSVPNTYTMNLNGTTSDTDATYEQKGGILATNNLGMTDDGFKFNKLDMILEDVTVEEPNLIAENLTLIDSTVTATGGEVGSNCAGDEKVTNVIIQGASKVTADTIGALGAQDETFTFVTVDNTAAITGILVRDLYRLNYNLNDPNFKKENGVLLTKEGGEEVKLHTVLRETTPEGGTATVDPTIPGDPIYKGGGTNYFENWYILQGEERNEMYALSTSEVDGFVGFTALSKDKLQYADPVATDGTQTLQIWARLKIRGTGVIVEERRLNDVTDATKNIVDIPTDGAWTAIFTAEGAKIENSKYQVAFSEALPQGTKLTLIDRTNGQHPVFYSYKVTADDVTTIAFDSFVRMGKADEKAELPAGVAGADLKTRILLAADFSDTNVSAENTEYDVTFQLKVGETTPIDIAKVSYKFNEAPVATLKADETKVTAAWSGDKRFDGQKLYLVGELGDTVSVPYNATAKVDGNDARWLGGNKVVLELGDAKDALNETSYAYTFSGLNAGNYLITWKLTASKDAYNVLGNELATDTVEITAAKPADSPSMKVVIKTIDGKPETSRVLAAGTAHTVVFDVETNSGKDLVDITVTKQGVLGEFREEAKTVSSNGNLPEPLAYFAENTPAGTYRVCFSIPDIDGTADDVYFTFIVE